MFLSLNICKLSSDSLTFIEQRWDRPVGEGMQRGACMQRGVGRSVHLELVFRYRGKRMRVCACVLLKEVRVHDKRWRKLKISS